MVNNDDSVDFLLMLEKYGLSIFKIFVNGQLIDIEISPIFNCAYFELIEALLKIVNEQKETECFLYDEPTRVGIKMGFSKIGSKNNRIHIKINSFEELYETFISIKQHSKEPKESKLMVEFTMGKNELLIKMYFQLKKIFCLLKDKEYSKDRGKYFPFEEYKRFENKMLEII